MTAVHKANIMKMSDGLFLKVLGALHCSSLPVFSIYNLYIVNLALAGVLVLSQC